VASRGRRKAVYAKANNEKMHAPCGCATLRRTF